MGAWVRGWMDGRMDGWMDGWDEWRKKKKKEREGGKKEEKKEGRTFERNDGYETFCAQATVKWLFCMWLVT